MSAMRTREAITDARSAAALFTRRTTVCNRWDLPLPFRERLLMSLVWRPEYKVPAWRIGGWLFVVDPLFAEQMALHANSDRIERREKLNRLRPGSNLPH